MKKKLYALNFLYGFGYTMASKILPAIIAVSGIASSAFQISFVNTGYHLARSLSGVFSGYLSDRLGRRKSMLIGFFVTALGAFLMLFADSVELYALAFFIVGIVASLFYVSLGAIASIIFKKKAEAFTTLEASYQLGFILGPLVGGALAVYLESIDFVLLGAQVHMTAPLIFLAWILICLTGFALSLSVPVTQTEQVTVKKTLKGLSAAFRSNLLGFALFFVLGSFAVGFLEGARDILVPLRAVDLGMQVLDVGIIFSVSAAITLLGVIPGGKIADMFGRGVGTFLGFSLVGVSFFLMGSADSLVMLALLTGTLSLGRSVALNTNRAFASDVVHERFRATGLSAADAMFLAGRVVGPLAAGLLKDSVAFAEAASLFAGVAVLLAMFSAFYYLAKEKATS